MLLSKRAIWTTPKCDFLILHSKDTVPSIGGISKVSQAVGFRKVELKRVLHLCIGLAGVLANKEGKDTRQGFFF